MLIYGLILIFIINLASMQYKIIFAVFLPFVSSVIKN